TASIGDSLNGSLSVGGGLTSMTVGRNVNGTVLVVGDIGTFAIAIGNMLGGLTTTGSITAANIHVLNVGTPNTPVLGDNLLGTVDVAGAIDNLSIAGALTGLVHETGTVLNLYVGGTIGTANPKFPGAPINLDTGDINNLFIGWTLTGTINAHAIGTASIVTAMGRAGTINAATIGSLTIGTANTAVAGQSL